MGLLICILGKKKVKRRNLETFGLSQMIMNLIVMRWVWREQSNHNWTPCIAAGDFCLFCSLNSWDVCLACYQKQFPRLKCLGRSFWICLSWGRILCCVAWRVILYDFAGWAQWFWQGGSDTGRPWRWWWGRPPAAVREVETANVGVTALPSIARKFSWQLSCSLPPHFTYIYWFYFCFLWLTQIE